MRPILGKQPKFPTQLDKERTLSQILAEEKELTLEKKPKKIRKKKFVSCLDCPEWITTKIVDGVVYGHCQVGITKCIHK